MKIRLLSGVVIKGKPGVRVGDVVDVSYNDAMELCGPGFAEVVSDDAAKVTPEPVQVREPEVENRDPVIEPKASKRSRKTLP
jgi:hypothetical protein